jgi:hypothetical protein
MLICIKYLYLDNNYIYTYELSNINIGIYNYSNLFCLIGINILDNNNYKIVYLSGDNRYNCDLQFRILIEFFIEKFNPNSLSYIEDNTNYYNYLNLGFIFISELNPKFRYVIKKKRTDIKSNIIIYDCGYSKYEMILK